ncbi:hypothetical protein PsorP6_013422 [Peronosclerospora sorghi]|uniref:Uncharacterized protein n=1 Tax=Peronosclerospora sorghi TaxID=230839 RepID=A0ACC0VIS5_9STRA|nr:hypothetical protein PsorP6_013422 [Peronosclerospora sorghi]
MVLRIPVISSIEGLGVAVRQRLGLEASSCSAFQLVEIVDVPIPTQHAWHLDASQRQALHNAEFILADTDVGANLLLDRAHFLRQEDASMLHKVKWVQSTYAGVERFFQLLSKRAAPPTFTLTRAGGIMHQAMAQYVLGWIVALERRFLDVPAFQHEQNFARDELKYRSFQPLTVSILGFGDIGEGIGRLIKTAGFQVVGFKRRVSTEDTDRLQASTDRVSDDLDDVLSVADFVVSVLPSTMETRGLLNLKRLEVCVEKKPVFINVGRGDVIKEDVLVTALDQGLFSKAVLDVFENEPLPRASRLWTHPLVLLTPHVSALSLAEDVADVFVKNLDRCLKQDPMLYQVDWSNGY